MGRGSSKSSGVGAATMTPAAIRWSGQSVEETVIKLESRLGDARREHNDVLAVMRAAAAALSAEDSERAASILDQGIAAHSSPASRAPKRNRRRSKRQSAQTQALLSNMP